MDTKGAGAQSTFRKIAQVVRTSTTMPTWIWFAASRKSSRWDRKPHLLHVQNSKCHGKFKFQMISVHPAVSAQTFPPFWRWMLFGPAGVMPVRIPSCHKSWGRMASLSSVHLQVEDFHGFFVFRKKWWRRDLELGMKQFPTRRTLKSPTKNAQNRGGASLFDEAIAFRDRCNDDMTSVVCCGMQWQYPLDTSMKFIIHTTFKCNLTHDVLQWPKNKKQEKTCGLTHGN